MEESTRWPDHVSIYSFSIILFIITLGFSGRWRVDVRNKNVRARQDRMGQVGG